MKSPVITVFFIAILLFISFHFLIILVPFSTPILFAATLAFGLYPLKKLIERGVPNTTAASLITTLLALAVAIPLALWAVFTVSEESGRGIRWLTRWIENKEYVTFIDWVSGLPVLERLRSTGLFEQAKEGLEVWAKEGLAKWGTSAASQAAGVMKNLLFLMVHALLAVFFFFVFLKDGQKIVEFVYRILPMEEESKKEVMLQMSETFSAVIHGQVLSSLIKSVLIGLTFWILGLPLPVFFAAVTFFASMLPIVGSAAVWFPFVVYLAAQHQTAHAVALFVIGGVMVSSVDNVVIPLVIGQRSGLPYALLLLGVVGGMIQYGMFGVFIGPVVMSLFFVLINIYRRQFTDPTRH